MSVARVTAIRGLIFSLLFCVGFAVLGTTAAAEDGAGLFAAKCAACHTIGKGRLVGPDLAGVGDRRTDDWIRLMIKSPDKMIAGDATAKKLFAEYRVPMVNFHLSDEQVKALTSFLTKGGVTTEGKTAGGAGENVSGTNSAPEKAITKPAGNVARGEAYFTGRSRLKNGGPACISCHAVKSQRVPFRGGLAKDLTDAALRLGTAGVIGILTGLPFPAMQSTYGERSLTDQEKADIAAFLKDAGLKYEPTPSCGSMVLLGGGGGFFLLMMIMAPLVWFRRRKANVNQRIYDRQSRSIN